MPDLHEAASEIRHATFRLARRLRQQRAVATVTDGQFAVMGALRWHGPSTLTALAEREGVTAPSMNRTVDCLEEEGYITRERDEQDRRKVIISITEAGAAVVDETIVRRDEWLARALSGLDGGDRDTLRHAARIILEVVDG
ncbi:MarR family winged helix-turn-helix transcriptional regulator [Microbacterium stercoris]|uniref:MarR family transcriptional regulator n=1 Tax=Microbacterium stercoris TaxID=2820289 RepID=A0A939TPP7_9MICO|nr:MarR family transcriptional regulator [Microbacterium stercoris]MBO3662625.1 MarR family transcriptional regulator [Microbacterium stercoris]